MVTPCLANGGVPLGMIIYPDTLFFLIPIIVIEAIVFKFHLRDLPWGENLKAITLSNLVSTLAGALCVAIPLILMELYLLWSAMGATSFRLNQGIGRVIGTVWLYLHASALNYGQFVANPLVRALLVVLSMTIVMTPFYLMSAWVEGKVNAHYLSSSALGAHNLKRLTWRANGYSYGFLILALSYVSITNPNGLMIVFDFIKQHLGY